jgi:hypothetical protein
MVVSQDGPRSPGPVVNYQLLLEKQVFRDDRAAAARLGEFCSDSQQVKK